MMKGMKFSTLVEVCGAMHFAYRVSGDVGSQRGGLMFVAPPGHLKTSAIEIVEQFPHAKIVSDLTVKALTAMRQDFISGEISTMAFSDFQKLYKRHGSVSSNIEGIVMALVEEGFRNPAFSDQRVTVTPARCTVIGGMTIKFFEEKISEWMDNGLARRFLWSRYAIKNMDVIDRALIQWKRAELDGGFTMKVPINAIPYKLNPTEAKRVLWQLRFQHDRRTPFIVAQRIICVLIWKLGESKAWSVWDDFVPSLSKEGTTLVI